ncbi:MAG: Gfo/Idh/MocA family oxidoreductase [Gemmatimonadaceae bacterium]|nr:Gfo/Idh/MocA family oxidoreductase [Chitinophagaceae bacterium]
MKRRTFVKNSAIAASAFAIIPSPACSGNEERVRLAIIGVGLRGQNHLDNALRRKDVEVVAICDVDERMLVMASALIKKSGKTMPAVFKGNPYAYRELLSSKNIDAVIIATPWEWHTPMIVDTLKAGIKYIGTEVVLGITLDDHWKVVRETEKRQAHVSMLENVCYRRDVMAVLNMVRLGMFGEILHLQGGYQHDLRGVKFNDGVGPYNVGAEFGEKGFSEAHWRTNHSVNRDGDLYPTHGIGPAAEMININRGNRFMSLNSFSTKARGLHEYVVSKGGPDHPNAKVKFKLGDIVTTQIRCANGETIFLQHDTNLPRPYSLGFRVQGTKGIWMDVNKSLYIEGVSEKAHQWQEAKTLLEKYDHPLWARWSKETEGAGHGGMDFFVLHGFIESVKRKVSPPMDVYDAAAWSAITPLSEKSIELGNQTVDFPDFTGGKWKERKNDFAITDEY